MRKTFKIGEYCIGGELQVISNKNTLTINAIDYEHREAILTKVFTLPNCLNNYELSEYLEELTSCYYAEQIINYIKNRI
jgi:hypothetical protein